MDLFTAIRLRALKAVVQPDQEYFYRRIMRWYSKTFFTPLAQVEDLPVEDVLQAYYEEEFANMSPEDLEKTRDEMLVTPEQHYESILAEEADEAEMFETSRILQAEEQRKKLEARKLKDQKIADVQHRQAGPIKPVELPETELPTAQPMKPPGNISMTFMDEADFERELEGFGNMTQPKK